MKFRSNKKRIQVNSTLVKKENRQDSDAIHEKVLAERKYFIDAAAVKTMKGRKTLREAELMTEIIRLVKFPCDVETIKHRITLLIEGQYIRIDDDD
jgi:cullin-4